MRSTSTPNRARPRLVFGLGLALCLGAGEARASIDNFVEVQIDAGEIATIARNLLRRNNNLCPQEVPCPSAPGSTCVVDHFDVGAPGTWSRSANASLVSINGFTALLTEKILFTQQVTAQLKTLTCAQMPGCDWEIPYSASVTFELFLGPSSELCLAPSNVSGLPPGVAPPETSFCFGIDLDDVTAAIGAPSGTISGSAISLNAAGTRIATRVEYGVSQSEYTFSRAVAWQAFLDGTLATSGAGGDWSMFTHESLILSAAENRIEAGLAGVSGFGLTSNIWSSWTSLGAAGGQVSLQFDAVATDTDCPNDIDIEPVTLETSTGINAAHDGLQTNGAIDWDLDDGDVFLCGFVFGGFVGASILAVIADSLTIDLSTLGNQCSPTGDTTFTCNQETHPLVLMLGQGHSAKLDLDAVTGSSDGLTMSGDIALMGGSSPPHAEVYVETPFLSYNASSCYSGECGYHGGLSVFGDAKICGVEFSPDPLGIFEITPPSNPGAPPAHWSITVSQWLDPAVEAAYKAAPYGLDATVWTTAGVETVEVAPVELAENHVEAVQCGADKIDYKLTYCMQVYEWPWEWIYWGWYPDEWLDSLAEVAVEIFDPQQQHLDFGLVQDLDVVVARDRDGLVLSVIVRASAHAGLGDGTFVSQGLAIPVTVPPRTFVADDGALIAYLLPDGYHATIQVEPALLPSSLIGSSFALDLSPAQLQHATR